ncbi:LOW QUALITY PROTEIN: T-complex protein 1 subunit zeta-2 [Mesoplodon densirostris]|uniref:LOW QUALITY PROTEIN: T-complex protein 1 subunit zeta-2 n=1 Tax=Mesoplodon densirostris TaxID=48708 RepID=UPI0028DB2662|nr:LOW QUALITY PROTEIN: T-complex protein 1 subunit zeta-2 [Mesoplodon densirostris]
MAAKKAINSKAEVARAQAALAVNVCAARGLQDVLRTNLCSKGAMKMLVSGAEDIRPTKDGIVLLREWQIQHPTASLIAKVATAQDDMTGDGTTSNVLIIGELLKQADLYISEGLHPRIIAEGFEVAKIKALEVLEQVKIKKEMKREILLDVARTSLQTKVHPQLADVLTEVVVDSVLAIRRPGYPIDLFMVEIMEMKHKSETKEVSSGFFYKTAEEKEKLVKAERKFIEDRVQKIIDLKDKVCAQSNKGFVVINQKGAGCVVPGAGAVEVAIAEAPVTYKHSIKGRALLGVQAFADALLIIPKVLAQNSGYDLQETLVKVQVEHSESKQPVGIDLNTGESMVAADAGVWDNYCVKKQLLHSCTVIATNILLVDEIMRAGMSSLKG